MSIIYKKGSLFDAPEGSILIHAVNSKGVWGRGIAQQMRNKFPESFQFYKEMCDEYGANLVGTVLESPEEKCYTISSLVTSEGYGKFKDSKDIIIFNTRTAVRFLLEDHLDRDVHSNKFNSGLFGIPWEETEKILKEIIKEVEYQKDWTVWSLA